METSLNVNRTAEEIKQKLRWLNSSHNTTRSGLPSNRNLDRPFKAPRIVTDKDGNTTLHPLDYMQTGQNGQRKITNGTLGDISSFQGGGATTKQPKAATRWVKGKGWDGEVINYHKVNNDRKARRVVSAGASGKVRNPRPRKASGFAIPANIFQDCEVKTRSQFVNLRNDLMTVKWIGELLMIKTIDSTAFLMLDKISDYIRKNWPEALFDMKKHDDVSIPSLMGRIKAGTIKKYKPIKGLEQRLEKAAYTLNCRDNDSNVVNAA